MTYRLTRNNKFIRISSGVVSVENLNAIRVLELMQLNHDQRSVHGGVAVKHMKGREKGCYSCVMLGTEYSHYT